MAETRPTARALVAVLTLLPALSACLSIEQPPDDLASRELVERPAQFAAAGEIPAELRHQPVQNDWVATFDDDTLTSLVTEAIAHNPDLQGAAAALSEARARTTSARASLWPWLDGVGTARRRPVEIANVSSEGVEILSGLREGETVITAGVRRIQDGLQVRLLDAPESGGKALQ